MFPERPRVDVIVPAYKSAETIRHCVDAILSQDYPTELVRVILIDNDTRDSLSYLANERVQVLREPRVGSYVARNTGILASEADVLAFTDADCKPHENWISAAISHMRATNTQRLAGRITQQPRCEELNSLECYQLALSFDQERLVTKGLSVTANMFVTRGLFRLVGNFNEQLLTGGDWEWSRRATALGYTISYCGNSIVEHPTRTTWKDLLQKTRRVNSRSGSNNLKKLILVFFTPIFITMALLPPINKGVRILNAKNLSRKQKLKAWLVACALKPYGRMYLLLTRLEVVKRSRS